jgi:hypothetical protein
LPLASQAAPACVNIFAPVSFTSIVTETTPLKQWRRWEQLANQARFRTSQAPVRVPFVKVPAGHVIVHSLGEVSAKLKALLEDPAGTFARWFRHPFAREAKLPYAAAPEDGSVEAYLTASRSLELNMGEEHYSIKLATERPHGPEGRIQLKKASVAEDIRDAKSRMPYIAQVDAKIGEEPTIVFAKEVVAVEDGETGEGFLIRELSFLGSGNYYLPAFSLPYVGREIAEYNGAEPEAFWKTHYAKVLGRAKAQLLLRYGLQMETPNAQNFLIELDPDLRPTGRIVIRDLSDTQLVRPIARALGEGDTLKSDHEARVANTNSLRPWGRNSLWKMDEAEERSFSEDTLHSWYHAHNQAYRQELERVLGVDLSRFKKLDLNSELDEFMVSRPVQMALAKHRAELIRRHRLGF